MRSFFLYIFLCLFFRTAAQSDPDSLWHVWNDHTLHDTSRLKALQGYAWSKMYSNPDSTAVLARLGMDYARSIGNLAWQGKAFNTLGASHHVKGEYAHALNYYQNSLNILQQVGELKAAASIYNNVGLIYREQGDIQKALGFYQKYLEIGQKLQNKEILSAAYNNLGLLYNDHGSHNQALGYFRQAYDLAVETKDTYGQALAYNNIGAAYYGQEQYARALEEYQKSLELRFKINDVRGIGLMYNNIGLIYKDTKEYDKAREYFEKALGIQQKLDDKLGLSNAYYSLGSLLLDTKQYAQAMKWCQKGLAIGEEIGAIRQIRNQCNCLYEAHKGLGDNREALEWYEKFMQYNDSLHKEETSMRLEQMEFAKQVMADSLGREEEKLKMEVLHREEVRRKDRLTNILVILGLLVLTIAIAVWSRMLYFRKYSQHYENKAQNLEKQQLINEIALLKTQVNPHFLFNSLSILASLVHVDPNLSEQFIDQLSKSYRYILEQKEQSLVTLRTELEFIRSYAFLLKIRFESKFDLRLNLSEEVLDKYKIAPLTLQLLVENAVKHNRMSVKEPLVVEVFAEGEYLIVQNKLQLRPQQVDSTGTGLDNIINRYALLTEKPVWAGERENEFVVKVPLLSV
ncbi:MAG TPA: tetratricopeptide repeat protein [Saprospiraceae bacterium]|nr:tetratricopeptide repeat protein [Saprospiraceae bacterium]